MEPQYRRCCGIDVHKKSVAVCVLSPVGNPKVGIRKRHFPTFTRDLKQLRTWLKNCKVTEIAMESTGQYWRPLWNVLEGHFAKLILVNPQHIKGLNGYKTDPKDAEWIAGLLDSGKLRGSWVPPREIRELRDLTRQRVHVLEDLNRVKNRIEQLCQTGNRKVSSVATDLFGVSGRKMLHAVVEGKHDAGWMADYAKGALRGKRRELELALDGSFTDNQRWLLDKELRQLEWLETQVQLLEQEIERRVVVFAEPLRRLMTIPGIDRKTAWTIVAELGVDMSVFADARHLASWAGLCPGNRESGGKRMSGRTRKANRYVKSGLCQAAWAASHTNNTYLSGFYRRLRVRKGAPKAVMALAHHMIAIVYNVLAHAEEYVELGSDYYDQRNKPRVVSRLVARLTRLGYYVNLAPVQQDTVGPEARWAELSRLAPAHIAPPVAPDRTPDSSEASESVPDPVVRELTQPDPMPGPTASADSLPIAEVDAIVTHKRGRPCKCAERGIICKHGRGPQSNSLGIRELAEGRFS
jgi:transposase